MLDIFYRGDNGSFMGSLEDPWHYFLFICLLNFSPCPHHSLKRRCDCDLTRSPEKWFAKLVLTYTVHHLQYSSLALVIFRASSSMDCLYKTASAAWYQFKLVPAQRSSSLPKHPSFPQNIWSSPSYQHAHSNRLSLTINMHISPLQSTLIMLHFISSSTVHLYYFSSAPLLSHQGAAV